MLGAPVAIPYPSAFFFCASEGCVVPKSLNLMALAGLAALWLAGNCRADDDDHRKKRDEGYRDNWKKYEEHRREDWKRHDEQQREWNKQQHQREKNLAEQYREDRKRHEESWRNL